MIYLIRHGETECNLAGVIQHGDDPLSARGRLQAERLGARLAAAQPAIGAIVASDYLRTLDTAEHIRRACGAPLSVEPLLRERHFGALRGRSVADIGDLWADDLAPDGGEDWPRFHVRVDAAWDAVVALAAHTDGALAVVSHGMVLHSLVLRRLALPDGVTPPRLFANASLTEIDRDAPWTVRRFDCREHLVGLDKAGL